MTTDEQGRRRIDLLTRWQLYALSASAPLVMVLVVVGSGGTNRLSGRQTAALLALVIAQTGACLMVLRAGVDRRVGGERPVRPPLVAACSLTLLGVLVSVAFADDTSPLTFGPAAGGSAILFCTALTAAVSPLLRPIRLAVCVAVPAALLYVVQSVTQDTVAWAMNYALAVGAAAAICGATLWMLDVLWQMHAARGVEARLAVAEERLRFSRDLHDVLGRNLALIAIDSELAEKLVLRGQDGSDELLARIRQTARDSMRELHDVVGAYRSTDLTTEIAGARSVLQAAGIETRVVGDGGDLPQDAQTTLGWVVREATTNILRHSDATAVTFDLAVDQEDTVLTIGNDGAHAAGKGGTGLVGLRERLAARGGDVVVSAEGGPSAHGTFVLVARLPVGT
ncbi:sensor histidine kinase [Cellulomonas chitinilytica]|uniref:sensor histidine kinase n=1 Tax=Cellulomonas chitinilytica TaxID=398759 RepID=UPI001940CED1|nr:histidine kinase [Cellulomonas chitinilytica]